MSRKLSYIPGESYGPYQMTLLRRSDRKDSKTGKQKWGIYQCWYCQEEFEARNYSIKTGETKGCPKCRSERRKKSFNIGELNFKYKTGMRLGPNNILFLEERPKYEGNLQRRGYFQCPICGQKWECQLSDIVSGKASKCRSCGNHHGISKGEELIKDILEKLNIYYFREYSFIDCRNPKTKNPLRFDFYLPAYNTCIEFDGIQHFQKTSWSHDDFKQRQYRDSIKTKYCEDNNIRLIRIPYWDYDNIDIEYLIKRLKSEESL